MPRKPLACKLHHISHLSEGAWIEITQVQDTGTKPKGGRNAQTIEILLRADHR